MASNQQIAINGNTSGAESNLQNQITTALIQSGGVGRIQGALKQRLDEAGWSENLRNYVTELFRSGECTTYFEAKEKAMRYISVEGESSSIPGSATENGANQPPNLTIPRSAAEGGVEAVKKELAEICEMK